MVRSLVSIKSQGQVGAVQGVAVALDLRGPAVNARSVQIARSIAGHWSRSGQGCRRPRLSCSHTPHSAWLRSPSGRVGVQWSLRSGGVSSVVHHSGHPVQRRAPNPRFERTAEKRRFSVPRRLRRRAASQASRSTSPVRTATPRNP
jgi:hypothetical protein